LYIAVDYLIKPLESLRVQTAVRKALETSDLKKNYESLLTNKILKPELFSHIITQNEFVQAQLSKLEKFAMSPYPVLITGDTGTGKELFAQAVHNASGKKGEYCTVNVAGIDDHMFSDTMFGHKKGAFTGADTNADGILKRAAGGTLFMDEIGDLSNTSQLKLLRLIQNGEYMSLGSNTSSQSLARIVMATNRTCAELKSDPNFRDDFFFRISSHHIHIPPLKQRIDDIPLLFEHLLTQVAAELDVEKPLFSKEILPMLSSYSFPGNVRELEQMIRTVVLSHPDQRLLISNFEEIINCPEKSGGSNSSVNNSWADTFDVLPSIKEIQKMLIDEALKRSGGNASNAAKMIGITRSAMSQRLKKFKNL